jgi:RHS repeat-associated protein
VQSNQDGVEDGVYYLLSDHLGGTSITLDVEGSKVAELRYSAWGETRFTDGDTPTQRRYTGQIEAEAGLYFYNARWYDPALGRFAQADMVVPNSNYPLAYDRYAYVYNNPINFVDLNGHEPWFIDGWSQDYMFTQQGNTCAVVAIAVSLSILTGHAYQQADIQPMFPHTYDFNIPYPANSTGKFVLPVGDNFRWKRMNIAPGVMPLEQEIVTNAMSPGQIQATFTQGSRADLMDNLLIGCPTIITIALPWPGVGHALVVVGYDPDTNELQFFNPAYGKIWSESNVVSFYGDGRGITTFEELWAQSNPVIPGYSMVTMGNAPSLPLISPSPNSRGGGDRRPGYNFW